MSEGRRLLQGISRAGAPVAAPEVELVEADGLQAICAPAPTQSDEADPEWLARAVQRHHAALQSAFRNGPVLPVRFGTVVDRAGIPALLTAFRPKLVEALRRFEGLAEWGVKLIAEPAKLIAAAEASSGAVRDLDAEISTSGPGRAYLLQRRRAAAVADAVEAHRIALTQAVRDRLMEVALDTADLPIPDVTPLGGEILSNLAVLVRGSDADPVAAALDEVAAGAGVELELSGPWPPYSFVELDLSEGGAE